MKHPPGTIGFSIGDIVRYIEFVRSLQTCWRPRGTTTSYGQSVSIPENMNTIIRAIPDKHEWLWIQADDHVWPRDSLRRLLDRQVDVIVPLIIRRGPPFVPVINKPHPDGGYLPFAYSEIPTDGSLMEVYVAGTGGMLIRRHVWERIVELQGHDRVFEVEQGEKLAEDYYLCRKIRDAGFTIWCDPTVTMGHQGTFAVWPEIDENGNWRLRFDVGRDRRTGQVNSFYYGTENQQQGGQE